MNFKHFKLFLLLLPACGLIEKTETHSIGDELSSVQNNGYTKKLLLPVNVAREIGERLSLQVVIPKGFRSLHMSDEGFMLEYIPQSDKDEYKWSEIITVHKFIGSCISALQFVRELKARSLATGSNHEVLTESYKSFNDHSKAVFSYAYSYKGRNEIMYCEYFSGPYDLVGFQISVALSDSITKEQALQKINEFVNNNTKLYKF